MPISKEQWADIDRALSSPYGRVELLCDGFKVELVVERTKKLKYQIVTYVNGVWKGAWFKGEAEEAKRFLRPVTRFANPPKLRKDLIKIYGGKRCPKKELERIHVKITYYDITWNSVRSMRRHFEQNNRELELVRIGHGL
jgi:hypothetical protein